MTDIFYLDQHSQRPLQLRSAEEQAADLGVDPLGKSPPEAALGRALLDVLLTDYTGPDCIFLFLPHGAVERAREMPAIGQCAQAVINVAPSVWCGPYCSDFLIEVKAVGAKRTARGTLECDGHDNHDLTQEQGRHDRARDRYFHSQGIFALRYIASEICENPHRCAREAVSVLLQRSAAEGEAA